MPRDRSPRSSSRSKFSATRARLERHSASLSGPSRSASVIRRTVDCLLACLGLFTMLPLFVCTAIAIKLDSPGPVFVRVPRVRGDGKRFNEYRFRTLAVEDGDPRVSRVGHVLIRTELYELPRLL